MPDYISKDLCCSKDEICENQVIANNNITNRELKVFFIITIGATALISILMMIGTYLQKDLSMFAQIQMFIPAVAAMIAIIKSDRKIESLNITFIKVYLVGALILSLLGVIQIFSGSSTLSMLYQVSIIATSIILLIVSQKKSYRNSSEYFGLILKSKLKKSVIYISVFVFLYFAYNTLGELLGLKLGIGSATDYLKLRGNALFGLLLLIPLFFLSFVPFLGEEYGWRFFLQPALQSRYGLRKGIFILGFIWGIWHLPLNFMLYSPQTPLLSLANNIIVCICYSIFFGLVFMKTNNIWTVSFIHFLNNNMVILYNTDNIYDINVTKEAVILGGIILVAMYFPFLASKSFKNIKGLDSKDEIIC